MEDASQEEIGALDSGEKLTATKTEDMEDSHKTMKNYFKSDGIETKEGKQHEGTYELNKDQLKKIQTKISFQQPFLSYFSV